MVVPNYAIHDRVQALLDNAGIPSAWIGGKTDFEDLGRNSFSWYVEGYTDTSPTIPIPLVNSEAEATFARWSTEGYPYTPINSTNAEGESFFVHRCVDFRTSAVPYGFVSTDPASQLGGWRYRECSQKKPAVCAGVSPLPDDPGYSEPSPPPAGQACTYVVAMCKVGLATSKWQKGCDIYAYGLGEGSFACESNAQSCTSTSRAYARLDATECELACDDHYDDGCNVPADCSNYRTQCKAGCTRAQLPEFDMDTVCAGPDGIGGDSWAPRPPPSVPPAPPPPAAPQQQYACTAAQIAASPLVTRAHCDALHAAYSRFEQSGFTYDNNPTPGAGELGVCVLNNPCVDDGSVADTSNWPCGALGGVSLAEARDTEYDYVLFYAAVASYYCGTAGQNTVVHCLCEATPPSAPPAPPPFTVQVQELGVTCADVGLDTVSSRDECTALGTTSPNPSSAVLNGFSELDLDTGDRSYDWDENAASGIIVMPEGCFYVVSADGTAETT